MSTSSLRSPSISPLVCTAAVAWFTVATHGSLPAQGLLSGRVSDEASGLGISAADVLLLGADGEVSTATVSDAAGEFRFQVDAGIYTLRVERLGYAPAERYPVEVRVREELRLMVRMDARAIPLEEVSIPLQPTGVIRIDEFRRRGAQNQRLGRGRVYLRADLERLGRQSAASLIASHPWGSRCDPVVLVDGLPPVESLGSIPATDLEGIEMYRGITQIPTEYYRYGMCGLILIWRRLDAPGSRRLSWPRAIAAGALVGLMYLLLP